MEPALQAIAPVLGHRQARRDIFREAGVIARGEGPPRLAAIVPGHEPDRSLRSDVDEIRTHLLHVARDRPWGYQRQSDLGISRARQRAEQRRGKEDHLEAELRRLLSKPLIGAHYPIDLRVPGIGRDKHPHQAAASNSSTRVSAVLMPSGGCVQRMISKTPSSVSATAVQLSTQSPVLM